VFSKPFKIGRFGGIFSMILKTGKSKTLTFKKYSAQKSAHFNKTADFSSLKTLNGVAWHSLVDRRIRFFHQG